MHYKDILNVLAPCGLNCGKCFAFNDGEIAENSKKLKSALGNFDVYAERFSTLIEEPRFKNYSQFKELLDCFAEGKCRGCREEMCKIFKSCKVRACSARYKVDFCFQCNEFPCGNTGFDEHLEKRYVEINNKMKVIGVESYFEEIKDKSRY